jgi:Domain of unknown function (DUF4440)
VIEPLPGDAERDSLHEADDARIDALLSDDFPKLEALLSEALILTHPDGRTDGKQSYLDSLRSGAVKFTSIKRGTASVRSNGDVGWIHRNLAIHRIKDGEGLDVYLKVLSAWEKQHGEWKLMAYASHRSSADEFAAAK